MATTNPDTPDSPATATVVDSENNGTSDVGTNSVPSGLTHNQRAERKFHCCTGMSILITTIIIMLATIVAAAGLGVYVSHLQLHRELDRVNDRIAKLETKCSGGCNNTFTNKTWPNSEVESIDELSARISNLSMEVERVKDSMSTLQNGIQTVQATHENDINQIGRNVSTMLTQINTSLIGSLQHFADEAASNISELNRYVERELSGARNHSLILTQNVSVLIEQVSLLDRRSDELEMNATAFKSNLNERLSSNEELLRDISTIQVEYAATIEQIRRNISSVGDRFEQQLSNTREYLNASLSGLNDSLDRRSDELEMNVIALERNLNERLLSLTVNVSNNEQLLRDISTMQVEHAATIEQMRRNISSVGDHFEQQLSNTREHLTATLSDLNDSLSQIDTSLSSDLNDLRGELMATKEVFIANASALREELAQLSKDLDYTNNNLTDLSSAQKDLADIKEIHSSNISAIGQSLIHLNEELGETNEHLDNLSFIQDSLQRDLGLTNEALRSNVSDLELKFSEEINRTEVQFQSQYTELWHNLSTTRGRLEANISTLQESHGHLQEDLDRTKVKLQTLSSEHVDLQGDYNTTKRAFYITKTAIEQNMTQVRALIRNHSLVIGEHSRQLVDAAWSRSTLMNRINETSNSVRTLNTRVSAIESNVTLVRNSVTSLSGTLTTNINSLNTSINDHVDWIKRSLDEQSQNLTSYDSRISAVEQRLRSDAVCVVPLGFLLLSAIALSVCYVIMF